MSIGPVALADLVEMPVTRKLVEAVVVGVALVGVIHRNRRRPRFFRAEAAALVARTRAASLS